VGKKTDLNHPPANKPRYTPLLQGPSTNIFSRIRDTEGRDSFRIDRLGNASMTLNGLTVAIEKYNAINRKLDVLPKMLLDILIQKLTEASSNKTLMLPLKEYMNLRGLADLKTAYKQVEGSLRILLAAKLSFKKHPKYYGGDFLNINILSMAGIDNGKIAVHFGEDFYGIIKRYPKMQQCLLSYRINVKKNPHGYLMLRRIAEHKRANLGKENEDRVSVAELIDATSIQQYDSLGEGRHFQQQVKGPFERDMDALKDILAWQYCGKDGSSPLDKNTYAKKSDYFYSLYVKIDWLNAPDYTEVLTAKNKRGLRKSKNRQ
jgi:hypothetical protein